MKDLKKSRYLFVSIQNVQDNITKSELLNAIRCGDVLTSSGSKYKWRHVVRHIHWDKRTMNIIHRFLTTEPESVATYLLRDPTDVSYTRSDRIVVGSILPHYQYNRALLQGILDDNSQWKDRYPCATALNLALSFIDAVFMTIMEGLTSADFVTFADKLCPILQTAPTPNHASGDINQNSDTGLFEAVQVMVEFMTEHNNRLTEMAHGNRGIQVMIESITEHKDRLNTTPVQEASNTKKLDELDDLIEDIFAILNDKKLVNVTLHAMWNLLQVVNLLSPTNFFMCTLLSST